MTLKMKKIKAAGTKVAKRLMVAADAALVAQGRAAEARQRRRALKATLKVVRGTAVVAGVAAATVLAVRARARAAQRRP